MYQYILHDCPFNQEIMGGRTSHAVDADTGMGTHCPWWQVFFLVWVRFSSSGLCVSLWCAIEAHWFCFRLQGVNTNVSVRLLGTRFKAGNCISEPCSGCRHRNGTHCPWFLLWVRSSAFAHWTSVLSVLDCRGHTRLKKPPHYHEVMVSALFAQMWSKISTNPAIVGRALLSIMHITAVGYQWSPDPSDCNFAQNLKPWTEEIPFSFSNDPKLHESQTIHTPLGLW
jgi:hypothetical protein